MLPVNPMTGSRIDDCGRSLMSTLTLRGPDLSHWDPENESTWDRRLAWRTLWITTYNLTLAFCVWYLVSAIAPRLNDIGYDLTTGQLYWLAAIPGLVGGVRAARLHVPAPGRRDPHARRRLGHAAPAADGGLGARRARPGHALHGAAAAGGRVGRRRRRVRRVHALDQLLLPAAHGGHRAGPAGRASATSASASSSCSCRGSSASACWARRRSPRSSAPTAPRSGCTTPAWCSSRGCCSAWSWPPSGCAASR